MLPPALCTVHLGIVTPGNRVSSERVQSIAITAIALTTVAVVELALVVVVGVCTSMRMCARVCMLCITPSCVGTSSFCWSQCVANVVQLSCNEYIFLEFIYCYHYCGWYLSTPLFEDIPRFVVKSNGSLWKGEGNVGTGFVMGRRVMRQTAFHYVYNNDLSNE